MFPRFTPKFFCESLWRHRAHPDQATKAKNVLVVENITGYHQKKFGSRIYDGSWDIRPQSFGEFPILRENGKFKFPEKIMKNTRFWVERLPKVSRPNRVRSTSYRRLKFCDNVRYKDFAHYVTVT